MGKITVTVTIAKSISLVWDCWTNPEHITKWNFASEDWECPSAENTLEVGGRLKSRMQAKDGSTGFDFEMTHLVVEEERKLVSKMDDGREVEVLFTSNDSDSTTVTETFDSEPENSIEMQKQGWQSILNNFKAYVESL